MPRSHRAVVSSVLLLWLACTSLLAAFPQAMAFNENLREEDVIDNELTGDSAVWEVKRLFGIFAWYDLHSGSWIKWQVLNASETDGIIARQGVWRALDADPISLNEFSIGDIPFKSTTTGIETIPSYDFLVEGVSPCNTAANLSALRGNLVYTKSFNTSYQLHPFWFLYAPKHWSQIAQTVTRGYVNHGLWRPSNFAPTQDYQPSLLENTSIYYKNEWHLSAYIDVVHIDIEIDEDNYDRMVFTRKEGILLSRRMHVQDPGTGYRGDAEIVIKARERILQPSPWYYVVIFAAIFGSIVVVSILIGLYISHRREEARKLSY